LMVRLVLLAVASATSVGLDSHAAPTIRMGPMDPSSSLL
jgi:hypothetical protein